MAQRPIELILLQQWASYLAMPVWLMGSDGWLLYYNEPAEPILGESFEETGPIPLDEISSKYQTTALDGSPLETEDLPIAIALGKGKPSHLPMRMKGIDGPWREVEVAAFPIVGRGRGGWSAIRHATAFAAAAEVGELVTFHHEPGRSDAQLDALLLERQNASGAALELVPGREGTSFDLGA